MHFLSHKLKRKHFISPVFKQRETHITYNYKYIVYYTTEKQEWSCSKYIYIHKMYRSVLLCQEYYHYMSMNICVPTWAHQKYGLYVASSECYKCFIFATKFYSHQNMLKVIHFISLRSIFFKFSCSSLECLEHIMNTEWFT